MNPIFSLNSSTPPQKTTLIGGKGVALQGMILGGFTTPQTACIPSSVYELFLKASGLGEKILLELNRKDLAENRWEEIWDISLRIRNLFLNQPVPEEIERHIINFVDSNFSDKPLAVRSSAPDEDNRNASFAGLHESYINIRGGMSVVEHVKKVWASLWSNRALLYRKELGLQVEKSSMAVIVQEMVSGSKSGIIFTHDPTNETQMIVESVHGLNQGLVDGAVEPDRWMIIRETAGIKEHISPSARDKIAVADHNGVVIAPLEENRAKKPPLSDVEITKLCRVALKIEKYLDGPQDIEWTWGESGLFILQARPITAIQEGGKKDKRSWYLSLTRSYSHLRQLRVTVENHLDEMERDTASFSRDDFTKTTDKELAKAIEKRIAANEKWSKIYWDYFIPYAHGIRLFGEVYNDIIKPKDPYEFVKLLSGEKLLSTTRNNLIMEIAELANSNHLLKEQLISVGIEHIDDPQFLAKYQQLKSLFGNPFHLYNKPGTKSISDDNKLLSIIIKYTDLPKNLKKQKEPDSSRLEEQFLFKLSTANFPFSGSEILALGRSSYRLRDDDNIILGKIEQQVNSAVQEGKARLIDRGVSGVDSLVESEVASLLRGIEIPRAPPKLVEKSNPQKDSHLQARQIIGQPASVGIARGRARVIGNTMPLEEFKNGEILVVDAIDPNMTFIAPLASAIVERRGGMLIHGAIIAREYGIPCVTGIPDATSMISTGDEISVDGYLGIVTVSRHISGQEN